MIQMRIRRRMGDIMSSQGLKLSGAGLQETDVELEQCSLKKAGMVFASGWLHREVHFDLSSNNTK